MILLQLLLQTVLAGPTILSEEDSQLIIATIAFDCRDARVCTIGFSESRSRFIMSYEHNGALRVIRGPISANSTLLALSRDIGCDIDTEYKKPRYCVIRAQETNRNRVKVRFDAIDEETSTLRCWELTSIGRTAQYKMREETCEP